jgi:signal recognition particle subunit SRP54
MGSLRTLFEKLPGMSDMLQHIPKEALDDRELVKVEAMIQSMTSEERDHPDLLDASRMKRIARGSGRSYEEVESLFQRFLETRAMMGTLGQSGLFGGLPGMGGPGMGGGGGRAQRRAGGGQPGGFPGFPGMPPFPGGFPGQGALPAPKPSLSKEEKEALLKKRKDKRKAEKAARRGR